MTKKSKKQLVAFCKSYIGDLKIVRPQITITDALKALLKKEHMKGNRSLITNKKIKELLRK